MAMDWDSPIPENADGSFAVLDPGEYWFRVVDLDQVYSEKTSAPMAKIRIEVRDQDGQRGTCYENLVLSDKAIWKVAQFFNSVGERKPGEAYKPRWNAIVGLFGRAKLKIEKDNKGIDRNKVDAFVERSERTPPPPDWVREPVAAKQPVEQLPADDIPF